MDDHILEIFMREVSLQTQFALAAFNGMVSEYQAIPTRSQELDNQSRAISERYDEQLEALRNAGAMDGALFSAKYRELMNQRSAEVASLYESGGTWPVFFFAYSFLLHTANVSKLIWPNPSVHGAEKKKVGEKVADLVALHNSRGPAIRQELDIHGDEWNIQSKDLRNDLEHYDERLEGWYVTSPRRNMADMGLMPRNAIAGLEDQDFRRNLDPQSLVFYIEGTDYDLVTMMREVEDIHARAKVWTRDNTGPAKWERERQKRLDTQEEATELPPDDPKEGP